MTVATRTCISKAIARSASIPSIEKLLVFLLFHCSKGDDHAKAIKDLEDSFQGNSSFLIIPRVVTSDPATLDICVSEIELSKPGASVCLTVGVSLCPMPYFQTLLFQLIWQYGDRHYHASRWGEAADWFMCGAHALFSSLGTCSLSKCLRKAAMCQLQQKEYAQAMATIRRCPQNGAPTRYVAFLIAVRQGPCGRLSAGMVC